MDWKNFLDNARNGFNELRKVTPETFEGFSQMGKLVKKDGDLSEKTKEFVALGIAISTKCESCIGLHIEHLIRLGATRKEIVEVLSVCSYMGGGPSIMFSAKALEAFDQLVKK